MDLPCVYVVFLALWSWNLLCESLVWRCKEMGLEVG